MLALRPIPAEVDIGLVESAVCDPPSSQWGMAISWRRQSRPVVVYVTQFSFGGLGGNKRAYLFGIRYDLKMALVNGRDLGDGHFVEFVVYTSDKPGEGVVHRLQQRGSTAFAEHPSGNDVISARDVKNPRSFCLGALPIWKSAEAEWPTLDGEPMTFLGQVELSKNRLTQEHLTWGVTIFVFWKAVGPNNCFKVVRQDSSFQTVEEHYEDEDRRRCIDGSEGRP